MSATKKINVTKNYRLFERSSNNRVTNVKKHKKLEKSMREYGFLSCFPVICGRDKKGNLIVKDGQHRLALAESLGLPVHWVEEEVDFDIAKVNCTSVGWQIRDYAMKYAAQGVKVYQEGMEFAEQHGLPLGVAFAMLGGRTSYSDIAPAFTDGTFKVKDRAWAELVASIYVPIVQMSPDVRSARFLDACMAVCRVKEFDPKRLLHSAARCREKLVSYSTRDAYLSMIEEVYNFSRHHLFGLKIAAVTVMRERNPAAKKNGKGKKVTAA